MIRECAKAFGSSLVIVGLPSVFGAFYGTPGAVVGFVGAAGLVIGWFANATAVNE